MLVLEMTLILPYFNKHKLLCEGVLHVRQVECVTIGCKGHLGETLSQINSVEIYSIKKKQFTP